MWFLVTVRDTYLFGAAVRVVATPAHLDVLVVQGENLVDAVHARRVRTA